LTDSKYIETIPVSALGDDLRLARTGGLPVPILSSVFGKLLTNLLLLGYFHRTILILQLTFCPRAWGRPSSRLAGRETLEVEAASVFL